MNSTDIKTIYHIILFSTLVFILYLLSGEYSFFPWSSQSDGYRFFHFIMTIPIPLIVGIFLGIIEMRKSKNWLSIIYICFPIICLIFSIGLFSVISFYYGEKNIFAICFSMSILLFLCEVFFVYYECKNQKNRIRR